MWVEILHGKVLARPLKASLGLIPRSSAAGSFISSSLTLLYEQKAKYQFIDMVGFRVLLWCRRTYHVVQEQCVNVGEPTLNRRSQCKSYIWQRFKDFMKAKTLAAPKIYVSIYA